jgi:preprotein translocase subunit SecE
MNLSQKWAGFREFLSDVKKESGKVTWPGKDEVVGTTTVVLVYTVLVGIFLFLVDTAVTPLVNKLFAAFGN